MALDLPSSIGPQMRFHRRCRNVLERGYALKKEARGKATWMGGSILLEYQPFERRLKGRKTHETSLGAFELSRFARPAGRCRPAAKLKSAQARFMPFSSPLSLRSKGYILAKLIRPSMLLFRGASFSKA